MANVLLPLFQNMANFATVTNMNYVGGNDLKDEGVAALLAELDTAEPMPRIIRALSLSDNHLTYMSGPPIANFMKKCHVCCWLVGLGCCYVGLVS